MILQCQSTIVFSELSELGFGISIKYLIWITFKFLNNFFQSFHLIRGIIIIITYKMSEWYNGIKKYLWSDPNSKENKQAEENQNMTKLSRINRLSSLLNNSVYGNQQKQQLCMFYSSLLDDYPQIRATMQRPSFIYQPDSYTPLLSFIITLKVQTQQIYCLLDMAIMFPPDISSNMPLFFIKNPNYQKYKPKEKFVNIKGENDNKKFEAYLGGLRVHVPQSNPERWDWSATNYYKEQNISNIVRWINKKLLLEQFPFSSRKLQKSEGPFTIKAKEMKTLFEDKIMNINKYENYEEIELLSNIQCLHSQLNAILSQQHIIDQENEKLKKYINDSQHFSIEQAFPKPQDEASNYILQTVSQFEAGIDVQNWLQKQYTQKKMVWSNFKPLIEQRCEKEFISLYKLSQLKIKSI